MLDLSLDLVVEFVTVVPEKFDAVVLVRIVRGGEDDAGIGAQRARDVGHAGRRQRADQQNVDAERRDAGDERILQHVAGKAGVLAEHDLGSRSRGPCACGLSCRENVRRRAPQLEGGLGGDRLHIGHAADAVRAKDFLRLRSPLIFYSSPAYVFAADRDR